MASYCRNRGDGRAVREEEVKEEDAKNAGEHICNDIRPPCTPRSRHGRRSRPVDCASNCKPAIHNRNALVHLRHFKCAYLCDCSGRSSFTMRPACPSPPRCLGRRFCWEIGDYCLRKNPSQGEAEVICEDRHERPPSTLPRGSAELAFIRC